MMESTAHGCQYVFPGYNETKLGDCGYFRIRDLASGHIVANVSQSIHHNFCSAVVDYHHNRVWTFCSAFGREAPGGGPCSTSKDCYVGAWSASLDDLTSWSPMTGAVEAGDVWVSVRCACDCD